MNSLSTVSGKNQEKRRIIIKAVCVLMCANCSVRLVFALQITVFFVDSEFDDVDGPGGAVLPFAQNQRWNFGVFVVSGLFYSELKEKFLSSFELSFERSRNKEHRAAT